MLFRACFPPILAILIYVITLYELRLWSENQIPILQQGTIAAAISISAYLAYMLIQLRKRSRDFKDVQIIITTSVLLACLFAVFSVSGLATIDRSLSVYLLTTIKDSGFQDNEKNRQKLFEEWSGLSDQVNQRIAEQMRLGTVENKQGTLCLSTQGRLEVQIYQTLGDFFHLNKSILSGMRSETKNSVNLDCTTHD